jgi:[acyl-carrier-protein] S-malonyltransferase
LSTGSHQNRCSGSTCGEELFADGNAPSQEHATVLLFPGQGSQTSDMRERVERWCPELARAAIDAVGEDPFTRASDSTAYAQPAIFCASVAGWRAAMDRSDPVGVVGHSLGEFGALVAAGSLDAFDALGLVALRGRLMRDVEEQAGSGGMAAVSGKDLSCVPKLARRCGLVVANDNAPHQMVLSGPDAGLRALLEGARAEGVRAVRLPVRGAFHSPMMKSVVGEFRKALAGVGVKPPRLLALCSTTGAPFTEIREELAAGIIRPVLWRETIERLRREGIRRFLEIGPGRVLTRLATTTYGDAVDALTVEDLALAGR